MGRGFERCPVCLEQRPVFFMTVQETDYWRCPGCAATLMDPAHRLTPEAEKSVYDLHDNDAGDPGYRRFLSKLSEPLLERLEPGAEVLDFGCGPGPVLAEMLGEKGMHVSAYDPIYAPEHALLDQSWDAITATEVFEHLHEPRKTLDRLAECLRPGGILAIMTCFQTDDHRFAGWHYRRDPTHVVFYREETLHRIGCWYEWQVVVPRKDVVLFLKPEQGSEPL